MTTFSKTAENFNVYVLDDAEAVSDLVETHNRMRKMKRLHKGVKSRKRPRPPDPCIIELNDCRDYEMRSSHSKISRRFDEVRHYNLIVPCDDRKMYGDLATIYKRMQAVYKDWYTYNLIRVAIVGNHSITARILKQAIEVQNTSIFTFEEVDNLLATFEQPMKTWLRAQPKCVKTT